MAAPPFHGDRPGDPRTELVRYLAAHGDAMRAGTGHPLRYAARLDQRGEPEVRIAAERAFEILTRLGAKPFLERLEAAMASRTPERDPLRSAAAESAPAV